MNRRVVTEDSTSYTVALDDAPSLGSRLWALVQGRLLDELTGTPVPDGITVRPIGGGFSTPSARAAVRTRVGSGGIVGVVGIPTTVFPQLDTQMYDVGLSVLAAGYVPVRTTRSLGPQGAFPNGFTPADVGDLSLHREAIVLRGRAMRRLPTGAMVPLPGATVRVTGIWRTIPPTNAVVPPLAPTFASLTPSLYANRGAAAGAVHAISVAQAVGQDKTTLSASAPGETMLRVSNHVGIVAGDVIVLDDGDPERREVLTVSSISGPSDPLQPATLTLAFPLAVPHARGVIVRHATVTPLGATDSVNVDAIVGDTTVLLASANTLGAATFVAVDGGTAGTEYHWLTPYTVTSDAAGYYRLPPMSRVAQLSVQAELAPYTSVPRTLSPTYTVREQSVDLLVT